MKYIGMPSGMRALVGRSFRKNLVGAFKGDDGTARSVTRAARPISAANIPLLRAVRGYKKKTRKSRRKHPCSLRGCFPFAHAYRLRQPLG